MDDKEKRLTSQQIFSVHIIDVVTKSLENISLSIILFRSIISKIIIKSHKASIDKYQVPNSYKKIH